VLGAAALAAACDFGNPDDQPSFGSGAPIHLVAANVGPGQALAPGAPIELFFDRLLLPSTVTRQSFPLTDLNAQAYGTPTIVYDPVARSVSLFPKTPLPPCQSFRVYLLTPAQGQGVGGLQAIDGATLDPKTQPYLEFPVAGTCATGLEAGVAEGGQDAGGEAGSGGGGDAAASEAGAGDAGANDAGSSVGTGVLPTIDFCADVLPIFRSTCSSFACHGGNTPVVGLRLDTSSGVASTAIGRVSVESNQGSRSTSVPPNALFGVDMPIIDSSGTQGAPGDSWLIYKLLLATPPASTPVTNYHSEPWGDMPSGERTTLGNYVYGSPMPFPPPPNLLLPGMGPLTLDQMEQISFWIEQGAPTPPCAGE
jgi:hypothetical protein